MSATFGNERQSMAGYEIGSGGFFIQVIVSMLTLALVGYNASHLHDYAESTFVTATTGLFKEYAIRAAAVALAAVEIPVGGVLSYTYRTRNGKIMTVPLFFTTVIAIIVASMSVIAGNGSQQVKADFKTNQINQHDTNILRFDDRLTSALNLRDMNLGLAKSIVDPNQRNVEESRIRYNYNNTVTRLRGEKATLQGSRPTVSYENGSLEHEISKNLFSILCSFCAIFLSCYSAVFLKPLVAIPAFTLIAKLQHAWDSSGADFKAVRHKVSPLGGFLSGWLRTQKSTDNKQAANPPTSGVNTTPPSDNNADLENSKKAAAESRPKPEKSRGLANWNTYSALGIRRPKQGANDAPDPSQAYRSITDSDIKSAKALILCGNIHPPTVLPVKNWLNFKRVGLSDTARQKTAQNILREMFEAGDLKLNPGQAYTKRQLAKYVLTSPLKPDNPDKSKGDTQRTVEADKGVYSDSDTAEASNIDGEGDYIGFFDITTRGGCCGTVSYTPIDQLIDEQNGIVTCEGCGAKYVAQTRLTKDSNPMTLSFKKQCIEAKARL